MKKFKQIQGLLYCSLIVLLLAPLHGISQVKEKEIKEQYQSWFSVNSTIRLTKKFGVVADLHMRRTHFIADPGFYFVRAGVSYWVKENLTATLGYGQMWVAPSKQNWHHYIQEHRLYQQVQLTSKIGKINMLQRIRNEQRWQEKIVDDHFINRYKFSDRVRYLLSFNIPVFKNPYYPALAIADEVAIQFGKEIVYNTFDQNRVFVGIKQPINKALSFDMGYMLLYQQKSSGYQYDRNHTFRLFFYYAPDFRKRK